MSLPVGFSGQPKALGFAPSPHRQLPLPPSAGVDRFVRRHHPSAPQFGAAVVSEEMESLITANQVNIPPGTDENKGQRLGIILRLIALAEPRDNTHTINALVHQAFDAVTAISKKHDINGAPLREQAYQPAPQEGLPALHVADYKGHLGILGSNGAFQIQNKLTKTQTQAIGENKVALYKAKKACATLGYDALRERATGSEKASYVVLNKPGADGRDVFGQPLDGTYLGGKKVEPA